MISPRRSRLGGSLTEIFQSPVKPTEVKTAGVIAEFYAVVLPKTAVLLEQDKPPFIFTDLSSTIQFCKRFKETARWKKFSNRQAAEEFCGNVDALTPVANVCVSSKEERKVSGERSPFRSPRSQDYVRFRKCIVDGDKNMLLNLVWSNPRYLIGGGDNPTILHEGCRYNAFHIAARCNKPEMLEVLLSLLRNDSLFRMLYPDDDEETMRQRIKYIINMYLNIPDKTKRGDRPLHFASALGFVQCVEVLINQEECVRDAPNGEGFTPVELAGTRVTQAWPFDVEKAIIALFNEHQVIVPILRDELFSEPPSLGAPMSLISKNFDFRNPPKPYSHCDGSGDKIQYHVVAYVGPVTKEHAINFVSDVHKKRASTADVRRRDAEKGLESVVRILAKDQEIRWNEFWPFLDDWADLTTRNGLLKFEEYFIKSFLTPQQDLNSESQNNNNNNQRVTKEHATVDCVKALKNVVDGVGVDDDSVRSLETDLEEADHDEVANSVASYVLQFMSEHEKKYVRAELSSLEQYPLNRMKSCVVKQILMLLDKEEPAECACQVQKSANNENNRENANGRRKSRLSVGDTLQICFIHGPLPTKTDYQVWLAIEPMAEIIEQHYFPAVHRWITNMAEFPTEQMVHWATPKKGQQSPITSPSSSSITSPDQQLSTTPLRPSKKGLRKNSRKPRRVEIIPTDVW